MKTFKQFINERVNYHIARGGEDPMEHKDRPIWFAHDKALKLGMHTLYSNIARDSNESPPDVYRAKIRGKIAHHGDPKIKKIIRNIKDTNKKTLNNQDYYHHIMNHHGIEGGNNISAILKHPITKTLQKHGYVGYRHPEISTAQLGGDEDEWDYPHEATMVFNRKHVSLKKHSPSKFVVSPKMDRYYHPEKYTKQHLP